MDLWQLFCRTWTSQTIRADASRLPVAYNDLQRCYAEPHRRHHVWYHIEKGLELIQEFRDVVNYPDRVVLAYFYHDRVYDVRRHDNELASAVSLHEALDAANAWSNSIDAMYDLILDTAHHLKRRRASIESQLIVSVDLVTLGFAPPLFERYSHNIYTEFVEYGGMQPDAFQKNQAAFFRSMLEQDVIYPFAPLRERFEAQARENLQRALAK